MKLTRIMKYKVLSLAGFFVVMGCLIGVGLLGQTAHALPWCESEGDQAGYDQLCSHQLWDSLPPEVKAAYGGDQAGYEKFQQLAKDCEGAIESPGDCQNAAALCLSYAVDTPVCTPGRVQQLTSCNDGRGTGDSTWDDSCSYLKDANVYYTRDIAKSYADKAALGGNCTTNEPANSAADYTARQKCSQEIIDACNSKLPNLNKVNSRPDQNGYNDYLQCLKDAERTTANDKPECEGRGYKWNDATNKCDPAPPPPPPAPGSQQNNGGAGAPAVKVDDPAAKENFGSCGVHKTGTDSSGNEQNSDVQTVLIGCDAGVCNTGSSGWSGAFKGTPVIACLIKFAVLALTVMVGVGSVAGIAWEAFKYAKAQDDQGAVSEARKRIRDIVVGIIIYVFMGAAINWLVPGGVIGG